MSVDRRPNLVLRVVSRRLPRAPWIVPSSFVLVVLLLLVGCVLFFPRYLVDRDLGSAPSAQLKPEARLKATNDVRTTLLQGLAGAFFLATALFTWRQIRISQRQLQLSEETQIAERFTKAVEQLAHQTLDVRLGGIFALEQIAVASAAYPDVVAEVLAAYVRERAPWTPARAAAPPDLAPDIQTVLTVLGRTVGERRSGKRPINLRATDLRGADLRDAVLPRVQLNGASLVRAHLEYADLEEARLVDADLSRAWLEQTDLREAKLIGATLEGARLVETDLRGADLTSAVVNRRTRLIGTKLEGAVLRRVALDQARYGRLSWDDKTVWPDGFTMRDEKPPQAAPAPAGA